MCSALVQLYVIYNKTALDNHSELKSVLSMMTWDQRFHHVEQAMMMERWWSHKVHQISITDVSEGGAMMKIYQAEFRVSSLCFCIYGPTLCIEYQYMALEITLMNHWSLTNGLAVIPSLEVHPLSEQLNGRLSPVHLEGRHVQVVHKEHQVLAQRRTKHTLTSERYILTLYVLSCVWGKDKSYLYLLSFLNTEKAQAVEILPCGKKRQGPVYPTVNSMVTKLNQRLKPHLNHNKANLRDLKAATGLWSGNAQFGSKSVMFCTVWPWNLMNDLGKQ